ncbi:YtxH domain-containing protein [Hymenobacter jejuensis]|uniref:YtxH domain-containing protein n=1 Tax=Hymenobacter jejuensis TaxID=2502781 RepID=A0A5B7ZXJ6_9BACT|nr:YtxH domain-containing protein [Hymenobacter jejuensis]QDA59285.1 YtxH domain-containing protein [Hymenobacter jejuensis]
MKDNSGKVILSLLAGATAGIVAGLLLAPETGDETRSGLKKSAAKLGDDLSKLLKDGLARVNDLKGSATGDQQPAGQSAADEVLQSMAGDTGTGSHHGAEPVTSPDDRSIASTQSPSGTSLSDVGGDDAPDGGLGRPGASSYGQGL